MSREILYCLKREQDICVKNVIHSQNTAFMFTPALKNQNKVLKPAVCLASPNTGGQKLVCEYSRLACVASVPERRERNSGRVKEVFAFGPLGKMGREQKSGRSGVGEGKEGNACPQTPRF